MPGLDRKICLSQSPFVLVKAKRWSLGGFFYPTLTFMIDSYILSVWLATPLTSAGEEQWTFLSKNCFKTILFIINYKRNYAICYGQVWTQKGGYSMKIVILKDILEKVDFEKNRQRTKTAWKTTRMQRVLRTYATKYFPYWNIFNTLHTVCFMHELSIYEIKRICHRAYFFRISYWSLQHLTNFLEI